MKAISQQTHAAYQAAVSALNHFKEVFDATEPAPLQGEMELIGEENRDFGRDQGKGWFANNPITLMDVYDMRKSFEESPEEGMTYEQYTNGEC